MPPETVIFSLEKSKLRKSSLLQSATNKVFRPTKPLNGVLLRSLIMLGKSRGLVISRLLLPLFIIDMQWKVKA